MRHRFEGLAARLSALVLIIVAAGAPLIAWAQSAPPPAPRLLKTSPPWLGLAVMFVLLAFVIVVSLMPSKRTHQD